AATTNRPSGDATIACARGPDCRTGWGPAPACDRTDDAGESPPSSRIGRTATLPAVKLATSTCRRTGCTATKHAPAPSLDTALIGLSRPSGRASKASTAPVPAIPNVLVSLAAYSAGRVGCNARKVGFSVST